MVDARGQKGAQQLLHQTKLLTAQVALKTPKEEGRRGVGLPRKPIWV